MNVYIDESGTFVSTAARGSWCVVAAYAVPEVGRRRLESAVAGLKLRASAGQAAELKDRSLREDQYLDFLASLVPAGGVLFCTATDSAANPIDRVVRHQALQVASIRDNLPRMKFEGGRAFVRDTASILEAMPPQLHAQLACQFNLMFDVIRHAINFYAQRHPATLREIRWRVDQKNTIKAAFEKSFERLVAPLMEARSLRRPLPWVKGFNYSHLAAYRMVGGAIPERLQTTAQRDDVGLLNVGKLARGHLQFVDSRASIGVQAADWLAWGVRRCLRGSFVDNDVIARSLGSLMVQHERGHESVELMSFSEDELPVDPAARRAVRIMTRASQRMLV